MSLYSVVANEKIDLSKNIGVEDITKIEWYTFEDALQNISYEKEDLIKAKEMFLECIYEEAKQ